MNLIIVDSGEDPDEDSSECFSYIGTVRRSKRKRGSEGRNGSKSFGESVHILYTRENEVSTSQDPLEVAVEETGKKDAEKRRKEGEERTRNRGTGFWRANL